MKILIADDHRLFCEGLQSILLKLNPAMQIMTVRNGTDALTILTESDDLDLALIDLRLPILDGFGLLSSLSSAGCLTPVVIITASADPADAKRALESGAMGFITKSSSGIQVMEAINQVLSGLTVCPLLEQYSPASDTHTRWAELHHISPRQLEVLRLLKRGMSNQEIAQQLSVSLSTVKSHVASLFAVLQAKSRSEVIQKATQLGLD